ncbi:MAG: hypothetical protein HKO59_12970 [Phycisphaerales bacterium]|nr:hypothetical protein [Phycisphaerales bacterium]
MILPSLMLALTTAASPATSPDQTSAVPTPRIGEMVTQRLQKPQESLERLEVNLGGEVLTLTLEPHSIRAAGFQVLVPGPAGLEAVEPPPSSVYRGTVVGRPGSRVAASVRAGTVQALIDLGPDDGTFVLEPASNLPGLEGTDPAVHVAYRASDVTPGGHTCGADLLTQPADPAAAAGGAGDDPADGAPIEVCEIAADTDHPYFLKNGSVEATVADIEAMIMMTAEIYERDVDVTYELTTIIVRSTLAGDPYSTGDPIGILCEFRNQWNSSPEVLIPRDTAQLFTGRVLIGPPVGIAWRSTICNVAFSSADCGGPVQNLGYSVVESRFTGATFNERVSVTAHELGHSWSALHCSGGTCHIMCDNIDGFGCGGIAGANLKFGPSSISQIVSFRNTRTCLVDEAAPLSVPFVEEFPTGGLDADAWVWSMPGTVAVSSAADAEPSPPWSMRLKRSSSNEFRAAEVRTATFPLDGLSGLELSYQVQTVGVEAGERLYAEYLNTDSAWAPLGQVVSTGADLGIFIPFTNGLPIGAYHDGFRFRFRTDSDEVDDIWYLDDVRLQSPVVECPADLDGSGDVGFTDLLQILAAWGPCAACPQDLDDSGDVGFTDLLQVLAAWGRCG